MYVQVHNKFEFKQ
jgi:hypothetical protein